MRSNLCRGSNLAHRKVNTALIVGVASARGGLLTNLDQMIVPDRWSTTMLAEQPSMNSNRSISIGAYTMSRFRFPKSPPAAQFKNVPPYVLEIAREIGVLRAPSLIESIYDYPCQACALAGQPPSNTRVIVGIGAESTPEGFVVRCTTCHTYAVIRTANKEPTSDFH